MTRPSELQLGKMLSERVDGEAARVEPVVVGDVELLHAAGAALRRVAVGGEREP